MIKAIIIAYVCACSAGVFYLGMRQYLGDTHCFSQSWCTLAVHACCRYQYACKLWDAVKKSPFISEYIRLLIM